MTYGLTLPEWQDMSEQTPDERAAVLAAVDRIVRMRRPDGREVSVPRTRVEERLKVGYALIDDEH